MLHMLCNTSGAPNPLDLLFTVMPLYIMASAVMAMGFDSNIYTTFIKIQSELQ